MPDRSGITAKLVAHHLFESGAGGRREATRHGTCTTTFGQSFERLLTSWKGCRIVLDAVGAG